MYSEILQFVQTLSIILGVIVALLAIKGRGDDKTTTLTEMKTDIKYIKETVSKIDPMQLKLLEVEHLAKQTKTELDCHIKAHQDGI